MHTYVILSTESVEINVMVNIRGLPKICRGGGIQETPRSITGNYLPPLLLIYSKQAEVVWLEEFLIAPHFLRRKYILQITVGMTMTQKKGGKIFLTF